MDQLFSILGTAGFPTSIAGALVFLFFWTKKYEAAVRAEMTMSLERLQKDKVELQARIKALEDEATERESKIDDLRASMREAEDNSIKHIREIEEDSIKHLRRAEEAELLLRLSTQGQ